MTACGSTDWDPEPVSSFSTLQLQLYERMLAEDSTRDNAEMLRDTLAGVRRRLAELEGDELAARRAARKDDPGE